jgi:hypothetical protein
MARSKETKKTKTKAKPARKPAARSKPAKKAEKPKSPAKAPAKAHGRPAPARAAAAPKAAPPVKGAQAKAAPAKTAPPAPPAKPGKAGKGGPAEAAGAAHPPAKPEKRKGSRKTATRRGDYPPGELLLPGGPQGADETQYLLRGCAAAERPAIEAGVTEIINKRALPESDRSEMTAYAQGMAGRFLSGPIEPLLPLRSQQRRNFQGVVERAKHRRREIGAFLRGLDLGHTETSHMDSHGEDSLEKLMQWAARLENLAEADEPETADYAQFHRGLDQIENQTEALIVDVENTLRRLRDRVRPQKG